MSPAVMSVLILAGLSAFTWTACRRWKLMFAARSPDNRMDRAGDRWAGVLKYMFGQARMFRYRGAGIAHAFIFAGFSILLLRTLILFSRGFAAGPTFGFWLFDDHAPLGKLYLFLKDLIGVLVIAGVVYFLYLRLGPRPKRLKHSAEGIFILCMILGIILSDMTYEATALIRATGADMPSFRAEVPAASLLAQALSPLPNGAINALHQAGFWLHAVIVLTFLNFLPYGKHFHILTVLPNVYFRDLRGIGRLRTIPDIEGKLEREETLGVKRAENLTWKAVLDLYTCTECGRCSDHCPATRSGKLLSPKFLTTSLRDHMYRNENALVQSSELVTHPGSSMPQAGDGTSTASAAPEPEAARAARTFVLANGAHDESGGDLTSSWIDPETLWACTTCGACEQECPVFISYVDKIVDMRRNLVMEKGEFPGQLQNAFRGLESVGNPYSFANEQRADWADGLDVPLKSAKPDADVLYWVGCAPSFDDRSRKIARATAQLMKLAGVDFAILGPEETCTGDPARRAGNEFLFQMFAQNNTATLNNYGVKRIVTTCPHCFNTLKNEYPDFGGRFEVVHHTDFLLQLVRAGRLRPEHDVLATIVYHDSCYLGRYNDVYDAPRELLKSVPGLTLVEAPESRDRGMCCGAGGAQMWKEEEHIRRTESDERGRVEGAGKVNHLRTRQLLKVLPSPGQPRAVASACPFCMTMLSDGLRDQGHEDVQRMDVAELLLKSVQGDSTTLS